MPWRPEGPNQDAGRAALPLTLSKQSSCLFRLQWGWSPSVALGSQLHHSLTSMTPCVSRLSPCEDIILLDFGVHPQWSHLKSITSAKILFPNKVTFIGAGGLKISTHPFQGNHLTHASMELLLLFKTGRTLCHQVSVINPTGQSTGVICKITNTILNDDLKLTLFIALGTGRQTNGYTLPRLFFLFSYFSISGYLHSSYTGFYMAQHPPPARPCLSPASRTYQRPYSLPFPLSSSM